MTERVTLTIDKEVLEKAREIAKTKRQTLSKTVSEALKAYLTAQRKREAYNKLKTAIERNPLTEEECAEALREIESMRKEMERW